MPLARFEKLIDEHYAALYRFALALTRQESDAADLTQQTFYLWASKGHQLRDASKVKTWLFTSLYRAHLASKRQQKRLVEIEEDVVLEASPLSASLIDQLDGATAEKALLKLSENYRAPLTLFYLREHSYREIAEILGIPIGTVMSRISRGKTELRKLLCGAGDFDTPEERPSTP